MLAAAVAAGASILVTTNLKDFPEEACAPYDVTVLHPDSFMLELFFQTPTACIEAVTRDAARKRRPSTTVSELLAGVTVIAPNFANTLHQAVLDGDQAMSNIPAYVAVPVEESPVRERGTNPDLTHPLHVALTWWTILSQLPEGKEVLDSLTWSPPAFAGYQWAADTLADKSIASKVYFAVDAPREVAFVRFVPEVAQSSQAFQAFVTREVVFMTLRRHSGGAWRVWVLAPAWSALRP